MTQIQANPPTPESNSGALKKLERSGVLGFSGGQGALFPAAITFDRIDDEEADAALVAWEHFLGPCNRPFGRHSFGLRIEGELVSVAVSASTVQRRCAHYDRYEVCELARLCSHPTHRDMSRVCLRLWRKIAAAAWSEFWPVRAYVSYSDSTRHSGDLYRFDGWRLVGETRGGRSGKTAKWSEPGKIISPKKVWAFQLPEGGAP